MGFFRKDKPIPVAIAQDTAMQQQQTPLVTTMVANKPIATTSYSTSYMYPVQQPSSMIYNPYNPYNPVPIPPDGGGGGYIPPQPQPIPPDGGGGIQPQPQPIPPDGGGGGGYIPPQPGPPGYDPCSPEEFQRQVENDPQINQIIDQIVASIPPNACGVRPPTRRREERVIQSNCPPRTAIIRRRLQSPEPDIIERHTVIRGQNDTVNIVIEKPGMPAPCIIEDTEEATLAPPRITHRVVCVPAGPPQCPPGSSAGGGGGGGGYPPAQPDYGPSGGGNGGSGGYIPSQPYQPGGGGYVPSQPYQPGGGGDAGSYPSSRQPGGQYYPYQPSSTRYPSSTQRYQLGQQFPSFSQQYSSQQPMYSSAYTQQYQRYPSSSQYMRSYQPQQQQQQLQSYQKPYYLPYQQQQQSYLPQQQQQRSYSPQQQQPLQSYQQPRISTTSSPTSLFSPIGSPQKSYNWPQTYIQSSQF